MALVIDEAKKDAEDVRGEHYWLHSFPVDVDRIAQSMGLLIERTFLREGVSGMLKSRPPDLPTIYVDERENEARQRFTIAHEIGHYVERINRGHTDFSFIDERGTKYDIHEFYADEFAGNLLMPADEIERQRRDGMSNVQMAKYFGVSPAAMVTRLRRIDRAGQVER